MTYFLKKEKVDGLGSLVDLFIHQLHAQQYPGRK